MAHGRAFLTTAPGAPRCSPEQRTPRGSALSGVGGGRARQGFSSPGSSQLSCRDVSPRCLSPHPGWADAVAGPLAPSPSLLLRPAWVSVSGVPREACGLPPRRHRLIPQADSSFRSASSHLSSLALHPPPKDPSPLHPLGRTHNPPALCDPGPWNNKPPGLECAGPWMFRVKDEMVGIAEKQTNRKHQCGSLLQQAAISFHAYSCWCPHSRIGKKSKKRRKKPKPV